MGLISLTVRGCPGPACELLQETPVSALLPTRLSKWLAMPGAHRSCGRVVCGAHVRMPKAFSASSQCRFRANDDAPCHESVAQSMCWLRWRVHAVPVPSTCCLVGHPPSLQTLHRLGQAFGAAALAARALFSTLASETAPSEFGRCSALPFEVSSALSALQQGAGCLAATLISRSRIPRRPPFPARSFSPPLRASPRCRWCVRAC